MENLQLASEMLKAQSEVQNLKKQNLLDSINNIEANSKKQKTYAIIRTACLGVIALCAVIGLIFFIITLNNLVPKVDEAVAHIDGAVADIDEMIVTLNSVDVVGMSEKINALVETGTNGINTALDDLEVALRDVTKSIGVIESIDIISLNKGITQLSEVLEPLSSFFGALK